MNTGKLTNKQLDTLIFKKIKQIRKETLVGSGIGRDCAILDIRDELLVISTDPITGSDTSSGRLCVNVCCNDIAAAGAEPVAMLITALIPTTATLDEFEMIIDDVLEACKNNNVDLIGGHTEVTTAVNRFILSGVCIGKDRNISEKKVYPGCKLVMSKVAGLEGTGIIAQTKYDILSQELDRSTLNRACKYLEDTSVVLEGRIGKSADVILMHDATEGGILGAAWEMAHNAELGITIFSDKIPITKETTSICDFYKIDPLKLISSGVMLFATENPENLIRELGNNNILATEIGEFEVKGKMIVLEKDDEYILNEPNSDELYKVID